MRCLTQGLIKRMRQSIFPLTAGYVVGWMSWLNWSATIGIELIAVSILMKRWFPDVPSWIWCVVFAVLLFAINALSSRSFAEVEFWFASIKVITIIAFIILGGAAMFGFLDMKGNEPAPMFSSFTDYGGLFPNGLSAILITMIAVNFSFQGTELVGIAKEVRVKIQRKRSRRQLTIQFGVYLFSLYYLFLFLLDYSLGGKQE